jgi:hypothetical protein
VLEAAGADDHAAPRLHQVPTPWGDQNPGDRAAFDVQVE